MGFCADVSILSRDTPAIGWECTEEDTFISYQEVVSYNYCFTTEETSGDSVSIFSHGTGTPNWSQTYYADMDKWRSIRSNKYYREDEYRLLPDTIYAPIIILEYRGRQFRVNVYLEEE
jgi:hypothetical protein